MSNPASHITINGVEYDLDSISQKTDFKDDFEKETFGFAAEFLNTETDEVTVQTSGSTGTPKSMQLSKEKMRNSARMTGKFFNLLLSV